MKLEFHYPTEVDLLDCFSLLKEMRTDLTPESFLEIYRAAKEEGNYTIILLQQEGINVAYMGYRVLTDFVHGRHLYIDDLVTTANVRSQGFGAKMLAKAEEIARELQCSNMRLCTGIQNEDGKRFYEKNGWDLRAVVYKKKLGH